MKLFNTEGEGTLLKHISNWEIYKSGLKNQYFSISAIESFPEFHTEIGPHKRDRGMKH